jgi:6-phosphogluconate dehydrogenase
VRTFGISALMDVVAQHFGFTPDVVVAAAMQAMERRRQPNRRQTVQLGMIGLGRMGANMVERLIRGGHQCVVNDVHPDAVAHLIAKGAKGTPELPAFVRMLSKPRVVWMMLPAAAVDPVLHSLIPLLDTGDIVADGGNSYYHDDIRRAKELKPVAFTTSMWVSAAVWGGLNAVTAT